MIRSSCNAVRCKPLRKREKLAKGCLGQRSLQPLLYFVFLFSIVKLFSFSPFSLFPSLSRLCSKPQVPPTSPIVLSLSLSLSLSLTFQFQFQFLFRAIRAKAKKRHTLCGNFNFKEFRFFLSWKLFPKKWSLVDDLSLKKERKTEVKWNRHYHCWIRISF